MPPRDTEAGARATFRAPMQAIVGTAGSPEARRLLVLARLVFRGLVLVRGRARTRVEGHAADLRGGETPPRYSTTRVGNRAEYDRALVQRTEASDRPAPLLL